MAITTRQVGMVTKCHIMRTNCPSDSHLGTVVKNMDVSCPITALKCPIASHRITEMKCLRDSHLITEARDRTDSRHTKRAKCPSDIHLGTGRKCQPGNRHHPITGMNRTTSGNSHPITGAGRDPTVRAPTGTKCPTDSHHSGAKGPHDNLLTMGMGYLLLGVHPITERETETETGMNSLKDNCHNM